LQRLVHMHSVSDGCYRCESHPAPSPDGMKVAFASNWAQDCVACGSVNEVKDYVLRVPKGTSTSLSAAADEDGTRTIDAPVTGHVAAFALASAWPNPATSHVAISYSLGEGGGGHLEMVDVRGRAVWTRELDGEAPGLHALDLARDRNWAAGVYWLRLTQPGHTAEQKVTLL